MRAGTRPKDRKGETDPIKRYTCAMTEPEMTALDTVEIIKLKPIVILIRIAFILHIASLCVVGIMYIMKDQLLPSLVPPIFQNSTFVSLPPIVFLPIAVIFILHLILITNYWIIIGRETNRMNRLRVVSILSFIFVFVVYPLIDRLGSLLYTPIIQEATSIDRTTIIIGLRDMINVGLSIRGLSMSVFLIAASMAFYYCFIKKNENKD